MNSYTKVKVIEYWLQFFQFVEENQRAKEKRNQIFQRLCHRDHICKNFMKTYDVSSAWRRNAKKNGSNKIFNKIISKRKELFPKMSPIFILVFEFSNRSAHWSKSANICFDEFLREIAIQVFLHEQKQRHFFPWGLPFTFNFLCVFGENKCIYRFSC